MAQWTVLGERVLQMRRRANVTQAALAKEVGVTTTTIARIEQGRSKYISTKVLEQMSLKLNVSADYLLGLSDESERKGARAIESDGAGYVPAGADIVEGDTAPAVHAVALPRDGVCA